MKESTVKDFVKALKSENKSTSAYDTTAKVTRIDGDTVWVHIAGGVDETPVKRTISAKAGDTVQVRVGGGNAWLTGNQTAPPTDDEKAEKAHTVATKAESKAENAQESADIAIESALVAKEASEKAIGFAESAQESAEIASAEADRAKQKADSVEGIAQAARTAAQSAETKAIEAKSSADSAKTSADKAIEDAGRAQQSADEASSSASTALSKANEAASAASSAQSSANTAKTSADQAVADAATANDAANTAGQAAAIAQAAAEAAQGDIDEQKTYFWHDTEGAHVLGDTYRTDVKDGLKVVRNSDGVMLANIKSDGATFKSGDGTQIAHLGYGETQGERSIVDAPYYDLGVRKANTTKGEYSVAEGNNTTASRSASHAEGKDTIASGIYSHAEGFNTEASGNTSHAEGVDTIASGNNSHTEGEHTEASGIYSHAEGERTIASGSASHAEGEGTTASSDYSHAQGKYNVDNSNHADIVGNGTNEYHRSNAYALDWNGNGHYMGDVYVGCTADSSGGTKLAKVTEIPDVSEKADKSTTYTKTEVDTKLGNKVDKVSGKGLSTNDYTTAEKNKLAGIDMDTKVDKEEGKGLSTNDYTTDEKDKLAGIQAGAEVNVQADWNATSGDAMILNKPSIPNFFAVEYKSTSGKSVSGNATAEFSINVEKTGYTPLGIVGRYIGYAPFSFIRESISGNTASVTVRNVTGSSNNTGTVGIYVLYVKN